MRETARTWLALIMISIDFFSFFFFVFVFTLPKMVKYFCRWYISAYMKVLTIMIPNARKLQGLLPSP